MSAFSLFSPAHALSLLCLYLEHTLPLSLARTPAIGFCKFALHHSPSPLSSNEQPPIPGSPSLHASRSATTENTIVSVIAAIGFADLCLAFAALTFLNSQCGAGNTTSVDEAPLLHSPNLLPLAAAAVLIVAVAFTYRHLVSRPHAATAAAVPAGNGRRRRSISGHLIMFVLCVSAGTLESLVFGFGGQAAGGGALCVLGRAALRALPAAATVAFFCGMMLIIVAHVRAGGEGGGGAGAVAGNGPVQGLLLRLLTNIAAGAAAALVGLMAMAMVLTLPGVKY